MTESTIEMVALDAVVHLQTTSILIRLYGQNESYFYQAPVTRRVGASSFIVSFHATSLVLEKVRLFGPLAVEARIGSERYQGELRLGSGTEASAHDVRGSCHLILDVCDRAAAEEGLEQRIIPIT